jgi:hypothetical protein
MAAHWFSIPNLYSGHSLDEVVKLLRPLGITLNAPAQRAYDYVDEHAVLKCTGGLTVRVRDGIVAWPHEALPERHVRVLLAAAQEAFIHRPTAGTRWDYRPRVNGMSYWSFEVMVAAREKRDG